MTEIYMRDVPKMEYDEDGCDVVHSKGAEGYGMAWLTANRALADQASYYVDVSQPACRALFPRLILSILQALEKGGHLNECSMKVGPEAGEARTALRRFSFIHED